MKRRQLISLFAGAALTAPFAARAQQAPGSARIGYLGITSLPLADQFLAGMRENGYIEGQNLSIERREYAGNIPRLAEFADELLRLKVDVIFATGPAPVRAVANVTRDIPVVAIDLESDPIEAGWAKSLARPGGNITGVFLDLPELIGKWLQFLSELVPNMARVAVLWDPETGGAQVEAARAAAHTLRVALEILEVRVPQDFEGRFAAMAGMHPDALLQLSSPLIFLQSKETAEFALTNRIPAISLFREFPDAGGLISYGPDVDRLYRRCGAYVARILKDAKPGELPIERPARFVFVINLRTAKEMGLATPQSLLARADRVIE
jgi:putative tryptophan/tyrosine transport system substrate-binding protein